MGKKRPETAEAYAKWLYCYEKTTDANTTLPAKVIVSTRVAAFVDGVHWERRRVRAKKRTNPEQS